MPFLKRIIFVLTILISGFVVNKVQAQSDARTHFIYIQSENQQPYYVILNKKSYSSSSVGYLIISKLTDGDYNITVGFPQDVYPASTYLLKINGNDAGFSLRKGSDKTWDMMDKLSQKALAVVTADGNSDEAAAASNTAGSQKKGNGFGDLLSRTSNDTTNYQAYAPAQKTDAENVAKATMPSSDNGVATATSKKGRGRKKTETVVAGATTEAPQENVAPKEKEDPNNESYESAAARSATQSIVKVGERSDRRGISLAFVITSGEKIDTVNAFFPGDSKKSILEDGEEATTAAPSENVSPEKAALKQEVDNRKISDNPFYKGSTAKATTNNDLGLFSDKDDNTTESAKTNKKKNADAVMKDDNAAVKSTDSKEIFNSTCNSMVSDKDLEKIRKKMIAKNSDEDMIAVVRKYIDTKCIYTSQIKELGGLLISDNGRFALYRILYPNVYDGGQFKTLEDQLLDKNYKSQFETLISNH